MDDVPVCPKCSARPHPHANFCWKCEYCLKADTVEWLKDEVAFLRKRIHFLGMTAAQARKVVREIHLPYGEWPDGFHKLDDELEQAAYIGEREGIDSGYPAFLIRSIPATTDFTRLPIGTRVFLYAMSTGGNSGPGTVKEQQGEGPDATVILCMDSETHLGFTECLRSELTVIDGEPRRTLDLN